MYTLLEVAAMAAHVALYTDGVRGSEERCMAFLTEESDVVVDATLRLGQVEGLDELEPGEFSAIRGIVRTAEWDLEADEENVLLVGADAPRVLTPDQGELLRRWNQLASDEGAVPNEGLSSRMARLIRKGVMPHSALRKDLASHCSIMEHVRDQEGAAIARDHEKLVKKVPAVLHLDIPGGVSEWNPDQDPLNLPACKKWVTEYPSGRVPYFTHLVDYKGRPVDGLVPLVGMNRTGQVSNIRELWWPSALDAYPAYGRRVRRGSFYYDRYEEVMNVVYQHLVQWDRPDEVSTLAMPSREYVYYSWEQEDGIWLHVLMGPDPREEDRLGRVKCGDWAHSSWWKRHPQAFRIVEGSTLSEVWGPAMLQLLARNQRVVFIGDDQAQGMAARYRTLGGRAKVRTMADYKGRVLATSGGPTPNMIVELAGMPRRYRVWKPSRHWVPDDLKARLQAMARHGWTDVTNQPQRVDDVVVRYPHSR